ncbi:hypothetical protein GWK47_055203 [Chionoecetes opilio]|uniref:Uncharacterized protein n=1 Tax=Chionoecetes opilio TaxID=41210 RepID=A0A8J5CPD2_CHIOP|nr:hypothetical protein GWK47_055203 [Chionoecetes opilio]
MEEDALEALAKGPQRQETIKELAELTAKAIKGEVPTTFRKPGAHHYGRWMAKAIYTLRMTMFKNEFELNAEELRSFQEMSVFLFPNLRPLFGFEATWPQTLLSTISLSSMISTSTETSLKDLGGHGELTSGTFGYLGTDLCWPWCLVQGDKVTIEEKTKWWKAGHDKDLDKKRWTTHPKILLRHFE